MNKKKWKDQGYQGSRYAAATPFLDSGHEHRVQNTETGEQRAVQVYNDQTLEDAIKTGNQWTEIDEPQSGEKLKDSGENASQANAEFDKTSGKSHSPVQARKFSDKQIVAVLHEAAREETTVRDLCRSYGVSESRFYKWRRLYAGMSPEQVTEMRKLKAENVRLKDELAESKAELKILRKASAKKA